MLIKRALNDFGAKKDMIKVSTEGRNHLPLNGSHYNKGNVLHLEIHMPKGYIVLTTVPIKEGYRLSL